MLLILSAGASQHFSSEGTIFSILQSQELIQRDTHLPWASLCRARAPSQEVWFWLSRLVFFSNISASLSSPCCHLHLLFRSTSWILVFLHFNFFRFFPYIYLYISDIVVLASVITMMNCSLIGLISLLHTILSMFQFLVHMPPPTPNSHETDKLHRFAT